MLYIYDIIEAIINVTKGRSS